MSNTWDTWGEQSGPRPRRVVQDFWENDASIKSYLGPNYVEPNMSSPNTSYQPCQAQSQINLLWSSVHPQESYSERSCSIFLLPKISTCQGNDSCC